MMTGLFQSADSPILIRNKKMKKALVTIGDQLGIVKMKYMKRSLT